MKNHRLKIATMLLFVFWGTIQVFAQQRIVTGTVVSGENEPLIGATVSEHGVHNGVITDLDGLFSIKLQSGEKAVVEISYIGYVSKKVEVTAGSNIRIVLKQDELTLDEVIVVGYGVQKKTNVSGSITSINAKELHSMSANNDAGLALQGKAPIYVTRSSGAPGTGASIFIRGISTMTDNSGPMWITDGVPGLPVNDFNEVESIQILKDAASTAIYGVSGANGVILVTTKRRNQGRPRVKYNAFVTFNDAMNLPYMLNTKDYVRMYKDRWTSQNPGSTETDMRNAIKPFYFKNEAELSQLPNTNWIDEMFRTGIETVHTLDVSGGSEKSSYYIQGTIKYDKGTYVNSDYKNQAFQTGFTQQPFKWLKFTQTLNYSHDKRNKNEVNWNIMRAIPFMNVYDDPSSSETTNPMNTGYGFLPLSLEKEVDWQGGNPLESAMMKDDWREGDNVWGNLQAIVTPLEGLVWTTNLSGSIGNWEEQTFRYNTYGGISVNQIDFVLGKNLQGRQFDWKQGHSKSYKLSTHVNYDKAFNLHETGSMVGLEMGQGRNTSSDGYVEWGIPVESYRTTALVDRSLKTGNNHFGESSDMAVFGRVTYAYDRRYLLTANFRNDWSGTFAPGKRSAFSPSVSAGWNVANEKFFTPEAINELKFRIGIGEAGNASVPGNIWRQEYSQRANGSWQANKMVNKDITWEKSVTFNIGTDFSAWNNCFQFSFDWYNKKTRDALLSVAIPQSSGHSSMSVNQGEIQNRGFEVITSYRNVIGEFAYSVSGNVSYNKNKALTLGLEENDFIAGGAYNRTYAGGPVAAINGFIADGIYQTQAEIDALNATAVANGFTSYDGDVKPGDLIFRDINGDGAINDDDYTIIGNPWPTWVYGLNFNFSFKGFDLSLNFQGVHDLDAYDTTRKFMENMNADWNSTSKVFNAWSETNRNSSQPRLGNASHNYGKNNSYMITDASYLKLKNLQIGYSFRPITIRKIGLESLRVYASMSNMFTITDFSGFDPEFMSGNNSERGIYNFLNLHPQSRSISLGLNLGF